MPPDPTRLPRTRSAQVGQLPRSFRDDGFPAPHSMKLPSLSALTILACSAIAYGATPEQEKAFVESCQKAFATKDEKTLKSFLYTEGAPADIVEMFTMMTLNGAGERPKIEWVTPSKADAARSHEPQEMPDGKIYKMPFAPSKQLVIESQD
jgi:hypothetical protein